MKKQSNPGLVIAMGFCIPDHKPGFLPFTLHTFLTPHPDPTLQALPSQTWSQPSSHQPVNLWWFFPCSKPPFLLKMKGWGWSQGAFPVLSLKKWVGWYLPSVSQLRSAYLLLQWPGQSIRPTFPGLGFALLLLCLPPFLVTLGDKNVFLLKVTFFQGMFLSVRELLPTS